MCDPLRRKIPRPGPVIAVENRSTTVSDAELSPMLAACQRQARRDFAPAWWGLGARTTVRLGVRAETDWPLIVADDAPQAAQALGWHSETAADLPLLVVYAQVCRDAGVPVSVTLSHEVLESVLNPSVSSWTHSPADGRFYATEACDAVQSLTYDIHQVPVSDFVTPAFFDTGSKGPYDHLGRLDVPLETAPGGYQVIIGPTGRVSHVYGSITALPELTNRPAHITGPTSEGRAS